uniref:Uncharacterized protein n=1 Tax=Davidia involucrata TaxID=16924 RepID=A0A5B7CB79_DAVIN
MAYYGSKLYEDDVGEYSNCYDIVPTQDSISLFSYEPKFIEYDPSDYGGTYDPHLTRTEINYSTYNFSEPKCIEYNPTPHGTGYFSSETQYIVSYSTSEINESDFVEYDMTPGGYDIAQTYGKPLPPSDEICYPPSMSEPNELYQKDDIDGDGNQPTKAIEDEQQFHDGGGDQPTKAIEEERQSHGGGGDRLSNGYDQLEKPSDSNKGEETEVYTCDDNYPWSAYGYGYNNQVPQPPYGYVSDAMDFCESIFGYWPCLSREDWKSHGGQEVADEESIDDHWKSARDYLFGSTHSYGEPRNGGGSYGDFSSSYSYKRHYQEPPLYRENSCLQQFRIFEDCDRPS